MFKINVMWYCKLPQDHVATRKTVFINNSSASSIMHFILLVEDEQINWLTYVPGMPIEGLSEVWPFWSTTAFRGLMHVNWRSKGILYVSKHSSPKTPGIWCRLIQKGLSEQSCKNDYCKSSSLFKIYFFLSRRNKTLKRYEKESESVCVRGVGLF